MSSSVIFQPMLHDPLGWKPSKSTYVDHYKWRKYRATSKDKKISTYGQQYQREQGNQSRPLTTNGEQTIDRVVVAKKNEDRQASPAVAYRYTPPKTPVYIVEYQQRPVSANESTTSDSKVPQRPPTALTAAQEKRRPLTAFETRQSAKEERSPIDLNNDNSRHWLTYPNPRTPQYIIDVKERLGQLKIPSTLARPSSASSQKQTPTPVVRPSSASTPRQQKQSNNDDQHHFLASNVRDTPEELRATRYRIDKHRYHPSLDNYPTRPQTCPVHPSETAKPQTPDEPRNVQTSKNDAWVVDEERRSTVPEYESSNMLIQMVDCDGLPNEYVEALDTANVAQEEYQRNLKKYTEFAYRLPESQSDSLIAYQTQQQPTGMSSPLRQVTRSTQNDFGSWVRTATDKERASAMKLLQDVLNQPAAGYDSQTRPRTVFKQPPAPPPVRTASATRKLGRTRTQHHFPCEICEKLLIKRHVWDLSGSEALTCPHHPQGIQVRPS